MTLAFTLFSGFVETPLVLLAGMHTKNLVIKHSPFVFITRVAVVELLFAFLPALLALLLGVERVYAATAVSRSLSFSFLFTFIFTTAQILILVLVFVWWYLPSYVISADRVMVLRGGLFEAREVANTYAITDVEVVQSGLGRRLDYGRLLLHTADMPEPARLDNVPNPAQYARLIEEMVQPELTPVAQTELRSATALIASGETQYAEFKASLQWDYKQNKRNKELYEPVMKNLAAFMNTAGGAVLIGVADDGTILGLQPDYDTLAKKDSDGFENVFNMAFNSMIGAEYRQFVDVSFPVIDGREICLAIARPAPGPAFLTHKGEEKFYIRTGNTSQWLPVSKATRYIQTRFNNSQSSMV